MGLYQGGLDRIRKYPLTSKKDPTAEVAFRAFIKFKYLYISHVEVPKLGALYEPTLLLKPTTS